MYSKQRWGYRVVVFILALVSTCAALQLWGQPSLARSALSKATSTAVAVQPSPNYRAPDAEKDAKKIVFTGDVFLGRHVETLLRQQGSGYPFAGLTSLATSTTAVVGNFEASIPATHIQTPNFTMTFSVDPRLLSGAHAFGFTHFSLANNHSDDYGQTGFMHTKTALQAAGFTVFGGHSLASSSVTVVQTGGQPVVIVGLYAVNRTVNATKAYALAAAAAPPRAVKIAYVHWGEEYQLRHSPAQEQLAHALIDAGFTAVIGHHPHVVQDIGWYKGAPIFYSLGNFIFDQYFSVDVQRELILSLTVVDGRPRFQLLPLTSEVTHSQPRQMGSSERQAFLAALAARSAPALQTEIVQGVVTGE